MLSVVEVFNAFIDDYRRKGEGMKGVKGEGKYRRPPGNFQNTC